MKKIDVIIVLSGFFLPIALWFGDFYFTKDQPMNGMWPPALLWLFALIFWEVIWLGVTIVWEVIVLRGTKHE